MTTTAASAPRIDHFVPAVAARLDRWCDLSRAAQAWAAHSSDRGPLAALQRIRASGAVGLYTDPATSVPPYSGNEGTSPHVSYRAAPKGADNQCNVEFEV